MGGGAPPGSESGRLALELNRFVGRQDDVTALTALLGRPGLVTLIGPPGAGKSRLALHVAEVGHAWMPVQRRLVDVSTCARSVRLLRLVARALGVGSRHASADAIASVLGDRNLLLVLDNCDRMVADCAELATTLTSRCPGLRLIASSRQRLGAPGETVWKVAPLAAGSALELFVERAREVDPHFVLDASNSAAVERICRQLDGLPLAIELAAAHVCALSVDQLAARLDDFVALLGYGLPTGTYHYTTLKAALESSVSQLNAVERRLLWRLAVFAGSWDLEAAVGVSTDEFVAAVEVPSALAGLVARSLVQTLADGPDVTTRYQVLEVIRQYVRRRFATTGDAAELAQRYAAWYQRWAESMHLGDGAPEQLEQLRREQPNLVAAMALAVASGKVDRGFSLATRLHGLWYVQGEFGQSRAWFSRLLALPGGSPAARAVLANWASNHALAQADFLTALKLSSEASAAAADLDDPTLRAIALDGLGLILLERGDLEQAGVIFEQERDVCQRTAGLDWLLCAVLYRLASVRLEYGLLTDARRLCEQALGLLRDTANAWILLRVEHVLGRIALEDGSLWQADHLLSDALARARALHDARGTVDVLLDLAWLEHRRKSPRIGRLHVGEALTLAEGGGQPLLLIRVLEAVVLLRAAARPEAVLRLAGVVAALRGQLGARPWLLQQAELERCVEAARDRLGAATADAAWSSGAALERSRAVLLARELLEAQAPGVAASAGMAGPAGTLTPREHEVAGLIARGMTNRAVGQALAISEGTARAHVEHILAKLGLRSRAEVAVRLSPADLEVDTDPDPVDRRLA